MSLPRYAEYKDSRVAWLGTVPSHWEVMRLMWVATINDETLPEGTPPDYEMAYVDIGSVSLDYGIERTELFTFQNAPSRARRQVRDGDVLVSTVRTYLKAIAPVSTPVGNMVVSTGFAVIRPKKNLWSGFAKYALQTYGFVNEVISRSTGVSYPAINASELVRISIPKPTLDEQATISTFLDRETGKIDALITEQKKLIALLAEKRQATISHAVTRGLNPSAPTKGSGITWLGEVPAHWALGKGGFYLTVISGFAFPSAGFSTDETDTRLLRGINVGVSRIKWDQAVYWSRSPNDGLDDYELRDGDLVIGMDRPLIADGMRVAKIQSTDLPCLLLQRVAKLKPGPLLVGDYFMRLLSSEMFVAHFSPDTTGVSVPHISPEQICNFIIPIPPVSEQQQIVAFLASETEKLTSLKAESERSISLLKERRSALIAAAVTGQIDVRGAAARPATTMEAMAA